jgi:hypothetical protein
MSRYDADRLDASIAAGSSGCARRSGVDCEAREGTRTIRSAVRKLIYSEIGSEMLASGAFQSGSRTSLIPGSS